MHYTDTNNYYGLFNVYQIVYSVSKKQHFPLTTIIEPLQSVNLRFRYICCSNISNLSTIGSESDRNMTCQVKILKSQFVNDIPECSIPLVVVIAGSRCYKTLRVQ